MSDSFAVAPTTPTRMLRRWRCSGRIDYLDVVAFVGRFDERTLDARAITGDSVAHQSNHVDVAVELPGGRIADAQGEYEDREEWVNDCGARQSLST